MCSERTCRTFITLLVMLVVCSASPCRAGWGKVSDEEKRMSPPPLLPEANAVIIYDRCSVFVSLDGIESSRWIRMKVFSKAGAEEVGEVGVYFEDGDRIKDLKAQTISPDGKVFKVESRDFFPKSVGGDKGKFFSFPRLDSGCLAEYHYRNLNERFGFLDPWRFQSDLYTMSSSFTLVLASGFTYSSSFSNVPRGKREVVVEQIPNLDDPTQPLKSFVWAMQDLLPVTDEPYMCAEENYLSSLNCQLVSWVGNHSTFNFIRNWADLGKEMQDVINGYAWGGDLDNLTRTLTEGVSDNKERARRLYAYVAQEIQAKPDNTRWFTNNDLSALRKNGYGTSNEKNVLLVELLKKAGLSAWPVLIGTRDHSAFDPENYQLRQFNRMIALVEIDSAALFLDAGTKYCPFGMLPPECRVYGGLRVDEKNSKPIAIRFSEPKNYRLDITQVRIDSSGEVTCSTTCTMTGHFSPLYGQLAEEHSETDFVKEHLLDALGAPFALDTADVNTDSAGNCVITAVYKMPGLARKFDNNLMLKPVSYMFRENPFKNKRRFFPVDFNFPFTYHNVVIIRSDRSIEASTLPRDTTLAIDGVTYRRAFQVSEGQVQLDAKLVMRNPFYEPGRYADVRQLFDGIAQLQQDDIVIVCR